MDDDDDDDPVVREIPVYLNRVEGDNDFYLLQYPLRPVYRPYGDHGQLYKIQRRPESKRLQLIYALNTDSNEYSAEAKSVIQSLLSLKADGKISAQEEAELESLQFHKLQSTSNDAVGCEYGLGFIKNGCLFITPASKLLQFRPRFEKEAQVAPGPNLTTASGSALEQQQESRFGLTHAQRKAKEDQEPYIDIDCFYDPDTPEAAEISGLLSTYSVQYCVEIQSDNINDSSINQLLQINDDDTDNLDLSSGSSKSVKYEIRSKRVSPNLEDEIVEKIPQILLDGNHEAYLDSLCSGCSSSLLAGTKISDMSAEGGVGTGPLSYLALSKLSLEDQIKQVLKTREIERFVNIKKLIATKTTSDNEIIQILLKPGIGIPLQGLWIADTDLMMPNVTSRWTELERNLRDFVLCFFNMGQSPPREQIKTNTGCPSDVLNRIMSGLYASKDGKLLPKIAPDTEFEASYQTVFNESKAKWGKQKAGEKYTLIKNFMINETSRQSMATSGSSVNKMEILDSYRVKRCMEQILKENGASTDDHILEKARTLLSEQIEQEIKSNLVSASSMTQKSLILEQRAKMSKILQEMGIHDLLPIVAESAEKFMGLWTIKKFAGEKDPYRKTLLDMYKGDAQRGITKKDFLEECLKRKLPCNLTDVATRQVFREVSVLIEGYWYYKASDKVQQII